MKRSEFIARLNELFGEEDDVEIYLEVGQRPFAEARYAHDIQIFIDNDGDAVIRP